MADSASRAPVSFWRSVAVRRVLAGGLLLAAGFVLEKAGVAHVRIIPVYVASMLLAGIDWLRHGWKELVHCREVGIEVLMAAAAVGAAVFGLWDEAAALVFLYGLAEAVEHLTYDRARRAVESLLALVPARATVLRNGGGGSPSKLPRFGGRIESACARASRSRQTASSRKVRRASTSPASRASRCPSTRCPVTGSSPAR